MAHYDIDMSVFGGKAPLVQYYVDAIELVAELDEQLGDSSARGAAFMRTVAAENEDAVAIANAIVEQIKGLSPVAKAVVMHQVSSNGDLRTALRTYVKENQPSEEQRTVSDEEVQVLWAKRSDAQKNAASFFAAFSTGGTLTKDELAHLPEPPAGRKGAAPGARGPVGRQLPKTIAWEISDKEGKLESHGVKTNAEAAKLAGTKVGEIRRAVEAAYPDTTPEHFTISIGGITIVGHVQANAEPEPTEVDEFDFDALESELDDNVDPEDLEID